MKKHIRNIILLSACVFTMIFILAGCGKKKMSDIAITESNMPKDCYLLGEELDLSFGSITFFVDDKEETLCFNEYGITVSGYDKDLLGEQTLTVSYKGKTTEYTVTVIERAAAIEYERHYFPGELFDVEKGKLKIQRTANSAYFVDFDSRDVRFSEFDSKIIGVQTITAFYTDAQGMTFEIPFSVTVHEPGDVSFTSPEKKNYESHETTLSVAGGYFTVSAKDDPNIRKDIPLLPENVSGFDPSLAGEDHRIEPLMQKLDVSYGDYRSEYTVSVYYSPVFFLGDCAEKLRDVDLLDGGKNITPDEAALSVYAAKIYFSLSDKDKELLSKNTVELIIRPAVFSLYELYSTELSKISESFAVNKKTGDLYFLTPTPETAIRDVAALSLGSSDFNTSAALLRLIRSEFSSLALSDSLSVQEYVTVASKENVDLLSEAAVIFARVHELLKDIPLGASAEILKNHEDAINAACEAFASAKLLTPDMTDMYALLKNWQGERDYSRTIYFYYCYAEKNGEGKIKDELIYCVPMPGILGDLYTAISLANSEIIFMRENSKGGRLPYDTTRFVSLYLQATELLERIAAGAGDLIRNLYEITDLDGAVKELRDADFGYLSLMSGALDSQKVTRLWTSYLDVLDSEDPKEEKYRILIKDIASLTPGEFYSFLCSLYSFYNESELGMMRSDTESSSEFSAVISAYSALLDDGISDLFTNLMEAAECYAVYSARGVGKDAFASLMKDAIDNCRALSDTEKEKAQLAFGDLYSRYFDIYESLTAPDSENSGDAIKEIESLLDSFFAVLDHITDVNISQTAKKESLMLLLSLYERANALYEILADDGAKLTLCTKNFADTSLTLDGALVKARESFIHYLVTTMIESTESSLYDLYRDTELGEFLAEASYVLEYEFFGTPLEKEKADSVSAALRELSREAKSLFLTVGCTLYYDGLESYYHSVFSSEEAKELSSLILEAEYVYLTHTEAPESEIAINNFTSKTESALAIYESLTDTEYVDSYLKPILDFCSEKYSSLK